MSENFDVDSEKNSKDDEVDLILETDDLNSLILIMNHIQLLMNLISMTIFPFVGKPMFQLNLGIDELQFRMLMEQRKKEIPRFIIDSIRK